MDLLTILLVISAILIIYSLGKVAWDFSYWQRHGVRCCPYPAFGFAFRPFHAWLTDYIELYGRAAGTYLGTKRMLLVADARIARQIAIEEPHKFAARCSQYVGSSSVTRGLFFLPAQADWKRIRSIVSPAFTSGKLRDMCQPIEAILEHFVANLRKEADTSCEFNIKRYCDSMAMDVIARCGFGIDVDSQSNPEHPLVVNVRRILGVDVTPSMLVCAFFPNLARFLRVEAFNWRSVKYFDALTREIVEKRLEAGGNAKDLIGLMLQNARDLEGVNLGEKVDGGSKLKSISMAEISAQSIFFFVAGYDTTNSTFAHIFYFLTKYPEWQERLYEEIKMNEDKLDYEHLKTFPVLNAIINETLRLKPPLLMVHRKSTEDAYIDNGAIFLSKGTLIALVPHMIHRDAAYFPDPEAFRPERFIDDDAASSPAYMPFGLGSRFCVGLRFALNELRLGLSYFIRIFRLEVNREIELEYFNGNMLCSPKSVYVKISTRIQNV